MLGCFKDRLIINYCLWEKQYPKLSLTKNDDIYIDILTH